ncbi:MAG: N-acetylmannosamine-6-phosphate 2-epimerase [Anaerolineae bacterium]|jgi:putative N-acetylmannosamine-6-phosphate epimerase|nr:N-acetylmannosamine-6-phosphate 2-epimerase [Anaerolineae bacterium]
MQREVFISRVRGRLIVSCQALADEPLHGADIMARMALAAQMGGAAAIRANGPDDVRSIRRQVALPVIGLYKDGSEGVYITPTIRHAVDMARAGADVVALDATGRPRPGGDTLADQISAIHAQGKLALADVSTLAEAVQAQALGADLAAPTLSGYTDYSPQLEGPDYALIQAMAATLHIPVIAEGRIRTPQEARLALDYGAVAVVVGSAITRPQLITETFVKELRRTI